LEIIGYWTPHYLQQKFERLQLANIQNLILCVDHTLICESIDPLLVSKLSKNVIFFKRRIKMEEIGEIIFQDNTPLSSFF
jgi:predicted nuclease of restriction endonuclease-like RecB superfamily